MIVALQTRPRKVNIFSLILAKEVEEEVMVAKILSIHDNKNGFLCFDLIDVLNCIDIHQWKWYISKNLDALGIPDTLETEKICTAAERSEQGIWLSSDALRLFAKQTLQVIDGRFVAFDALIDSLLPPLDFDLRFSPNSHAECIIEAIDSTMFFVYVKNEAQIQSIRSYFTDVREEDEEKYFMRD